MVLRGRTISRRDVAIIFIVVGLLVVALYPQLYQLVTKQPYGVPTPTPTPTPTLAEAYVGPVKFVCYTRNAFKTENALALTPSWYRKTETGWFSIGSGNMTVTLQTGDKGVLYLMPYAAANYVKDSLVKEANKEYITGVEYVDIDDDGYLEHMFKMVLTKDNVKSPAGTTPELSLIAYGIPFDSTLKWNTPSNITSIGTAPVDKYINWKMVWSAVDKGAKVLRLKFVTNATDNDEIDLVLLDSVLAKYGSDKIDWEGVNKQWVIDLDLEEESEAYAKLLEYKEGMNDAFAYFTAKIHCTFSTTNKCYYIDVTAISIKPDNSLYTVPVNRVTLKS